MDTFFNIILDLLAIVGIIVFGSFVIVLVADLILCLFDDHDGIIFRRGKGDDSSTVTVNNTNCVEKRDDIVVYNNQQNPNITSFEETKTTTTQESQGQFFGGDRVESVDFDKALEEQNRLNASFAPVPEPAPKKVEPAPVSNDGIYWDDDNDDEFNAILDEVIAEAKNYDEVQKEKVEEEVVEEPKKSVIDEATQKELDELRALKEQQQKEIEEFRQMKEDFAREKEEQLAMLKENLENAKADEIEKLKQEAIEEQVKLEELQLELEEEAVEEKEVAPNVQPIVKETIIKDEEELNKLKYKNLVRMNSRLTRIIRDTERLQRQKQEEQFKLAEEKRKLQEKEIQDRQREQARITNIQLKNQELLLRQQEQLRKKDALNRLNNTANRVGKYKLDSKKVVKVAGGEEPKEHKIVEEVVTTVETVPVEHKTEIETIDKAPMKSTAKPLFDKEYYELKLAELDEELKEAEKELRINKAEYLPLTRIHKAYVRDSEKLRKKELQVAKQKVAIYGHGVNSAKVDPAKKQKLEENLQMLAELKDSVEHCEEVIKKNRDRYPILEKNNKLINKQIERIYEDIKVCEKAIAYYNKNV